MTVFGAVHLGYIVIETRRFADWRRFGVDAIGMHADDVDPRTMRFRLDDHETFNQVLARVADRAREPVVAALSGAGVPDNRY